MVWLIAILCLALCGFVGFTIGPVRSLFSLVGFAFGVALAGLLSPLTKHLLPLAGFHHPFWSLFLPQVIAFFIVLIIFMIGGNHVHHRILMHFKYDEEDARFILWSRLYSRLGLSVGLINGAVYFVLIMAPIYVGGYFAAEAASTTDSGGAKFLAHTREDIHSLGLDRVLAAYDPLPAQMYQASDIIDLVLHNPDLGDRLAHYPPFLTLAQRQEYQDLASDQDLQKLLASGASIREILDYPRVHAMLTNSAVTSDVYALLGSDSAGLTDLQQYLLTGKSAKYDSETILGSWEVNPEATYGWVRRRNGNLTPLQLSRERARLSSFVPGISFVATIDNKILLKKQNDADPSLPSATVASGSWKKDGDDYIVDLPGSHPEAAQLQFENGQRFLLPKDGDVLVFDKD